MTSATQPVLSGTWFPHVNSGARPGVSDPHDERQPQGLSLTLEATRGPQGVTQPQDRAGLGQDCFEVEALGPPEFSPSGSQMVPEGQAHSSKAERSQHTRGPPADIGDRGLVLPPGSLGKSQQSCEQPLLQLEEGSSREHPIRGSCEDQRCTKVASWVARTHQP